jgi:hypothetical protein
VDKNPREINHLEKDDAATPALAQSMQLVHGLMVISTNRPRP